MRLADVTPRRIRELESGGASTNHVEQMAMSMAALARSHLGTLGDHEAGLVSPRFLDRMRAGAALAWDCFGSDVFEIAASWKSDTTRGWAAFAVDLAPGGTAQRLALAECFARDNHFAVREWAWLGVRPTVLSDTPQAIQILSARCSDGSANLRRFCSEVTRPRSVWGVHSTVLKSDPELGRPVLDQLVSDSSRYVQLSVGNWMNDAARSNPSWVRATCDRWHREHGVQAALVLRRATRSMP